MESYRDFALIYDQLMNDIDYDKWFEYIKKIYKEKGYEPRSILEMACGTGNFTELLCEDGFDVTCFDLSQDMLSVAFDKLRLYRNVDILTQDMVDFNLNKTYDSVLSICDSINYIIEYEDLIKVFNNAYKHLNDGGIFIFDVNSHYKLKNIIGNNTFVVDNEDVFYVWENNFDNQTNICEFFLSFFVKEEGEKYRRFDEEHIEKAYKIQEIIEALKSSGFKEIYAYDAFTFKEPSDVSERINYIAIK